MPPSHFKFFAGEFVKKTSIELFDWSLLKRRGSLAKGSEKARDPATPKIERSASPVAIAPRSDVNESQ